jgi:hypothetical protein
MRQTRLRSSTVCKQPLATVHSGSNEPGRFTQLSSKGAGRATGPPEKRGRKVTVAGKSEVHGQPRQIFRRAK